MNPLLQQFRHWMLQVHRQRGINGGGGRLMYRCPAHEDTRRSLSVRIGKDGKLDLHCFAGCPPGRIRSALGWNGKGFEMLANTSPPEEEEDAPDIFLGRQLLQEVWEATSQDPLTPQAREYVRARKLPWRIAQLRSSEKVWDYLQGHYEGDLLQRCRLAYPARDGEWKPVLALRRKRILIPYWYEGRLVHLRSRSLSDKDAVRYCGLSGWPSEVYIADAKENSTVFVVEGEFKALLLRYWGGFPSVGLPGVYSAHDRLLALCRQRNLKAIILFDWEPRNLSVARGARNLCYLLQSHGIPAQVAWLQDNTISDRIAPDDYLLQYGPFRFVNSLRKEPSRKEEKEEFVV